MLYEYFNDRIQSTMKKILFWRTSVTIAYNLRCIFVNLPKCYVSIYAVLSMRMVEKSSY